MPDNSTTDRTVSDEQPKSTMNRHTSDRINRRRFLTGAGAAGAAALAGCIGGGGSGGQGGGRTGNTKKGTTTLTYWTLFAGGDGKAMKQMIDAFNAEHDDIQIKEQRIPWDQYYTKLYTSMTGNNPPDIGVVHVSRMKRFGPVMEPLDNVIDTSKYAEVTTKKATVDGSLRGVPLDLHPVATYYNKEVFEKAGLDPEKDIMGTWDEFSAACNQIVENTKATSYDNGAGSHGLRVTQPWLTELGSGLLKQEGDTWKMAFNNDDGLKVATIIDKMVSEWNWHKKDGSVAWEAFINNGHAMLNEGTWAYGRYKNAKFDWGVMRSPPMPGTNKNLTWSNSHTLAVPASNDRSKEKTKAAKEAARWLTHAGVTWGKVAGHIPAYDKARHAKELKQAPVWDKTLSMFVDIVENGDVVYIPQTEKNSEYMAACYQNLDAVRTQNLKPKPALDKIETQVQQIFA